MGTAVSWSDVSVAKPGFKLNYIEAVKAVVEAVGGPIILPQWFLLGYPRFLPGHDTIRKIGYGIKEFPVHTNDMLDSERHRMESDGSATQGNIMSQLLQASEQAPNNDAKSVAGSPSKYLSDDEMMGNLFIFTAAGFDTTANTVSYALVLLARYPHWQDWLLSEVDQIMPDDTSKELDYAAIFPKAIRVLAFMHETLRLFPPLIHISKQTSSAQTIQTSKATYYIPADTTTYVNCVALHLDPDVWRNLNLGEGEKAADGDEYHFRPSRWLNPTGSQQPLFQPPKGAYVPWSAGPRVCPGQRMAQVEFVAIFLTLLRRNKIDAVLLDGETSEDVDKRLDMRMRDSQSILTSQMKNVYDVSESDENALSLKISRR